MRFPRESAHLDITHKPRVSRSIRGTATIFSKHYAIPSLEGGVMTENVRHAIRASPELSCQARRLTTVGKPAVSQCMEFPLEAPYPSLPSCTVTLAWPISVVAPSR